MSIDVPAGPGAGRRGGSGRSGGGRGGGGANSGGRTRDRAAAAGGRTAAVVALRPAADPVTAVRQTAAGAAAATDRHLRRCSLAPRTVLAYRRQIDKYVAWLSANAEAHPDAFTDRVGAEGAVTAWRRHLVTGRSAPSSVNHALTAVDLLYEHGAGLRIAVKRARSPRPSSRAPTAADPARPRRWPRSAPGDSLVVPKPDRRASPVPDARATPRRPVGPASGPRGGSLFVLECRRGVAQRPQPGQMRRRRSRGR